MLPYAKYRHSYYKPPDHTHMIGALGANRHIHRIHPSSPQFMVRHTRWILHWEIPPPSHNKNRQSPPGKIKSYEPPPKPKDCSSHCDRITRHLMWHIMYAQRHRSDRLALASQHPPPTKWLVMNSHVRWSLHWEIPPPCKRKGQSPTGLIKTKDPPPKHRGYYLLCCGLSSRLMCPDIIMRSNRRDKLTLASEHPPPTWRLVMNSCAHWRLIWESPPPLTRGSDRHPIANTASPREPEKPTRSKYMPVPDNIIHFSRKVKAMPCCLEQRYQKGHEHVQERLLGLYNAMCNALSSPMKLAMSKAIYNSNIICYLTDFRDGLIVTNTIKQIGQILPSHKEFSDHNCLVGKYCLAKPAYSRKRYML